MVDKLFDCPCVFCNKFITSESQQKDGAGGIVSVGKMIGPRQFWYGLSGIMEFKQDLGLKAGDSFCYECMKKRKDLFQPSLTIKCVNCEKMYQKLWEQSHMGYDCSADVEERDGKLTVGAGYGSRYDCMVFDLTIPIFKVGDVLCDTCIAEFIEENTLVERK